MDEGSPVWAGDESAAGPGWACNFRSSLGWVSGDQDPASCTHLSAVLSPADPQRTLLRSSVSTPRGSFLPLACTPPRTGRSLPRRRLSSTIRRFSMFRTAAPGTQAGPHRRLGRTPEPAPSFACSFCPRLPRPGPPTPSSFPVSSNLRPFSPSCARVPSPLATSLPLPVPHPCTAPPPREGSRLPLGSCGGAPAPPRCPANSPSPRRGLSLGVSSRSQAVSAVAQGQEAGAGAPGCCPPRAGTGTAAGLPDRHTRAGPADQALRRRQTGLLVQRGGAGRRRGWSMGDAPPAGMVGPPP